MLLLDDLQLNAPGPPQVTGAQTQVVGTIGGRQYWYWIVAKFPIGPSLTGPIFQRNAPDTLNATNYVKIVWDAAIAATSYDVLRTDSPNFPGGPGNFALAIGLSAATTTYNDQGAGLIAYNPTGLQYGAPVTRRVHLNNRDYPQPTMEIDAQVKVAVLAFPDGSTQSTAAGAGSAQTPWLTDIDGNGKSLTNALNIGATGTISTTGAVNASSFTLNGQPFGQTPWTSDIDGNAKDLNNARNLRCSTSVSVTTAPNTTLMDPNSVTWQTNGVRRWTLTKITAESGSGNSGSDLALIRFSDTGTNLGSAVTFSRPTGNIVCDTGTGFFQATAKIYCGGSINILPDVTNTSYVNYYGGGGLFRWVVGKSGATESGSNVGSDYVITRYNDAGASLGAAMTINRATGNVTLSNNLSTGGTLDVNGGRVNMGVDAGNTGFIYFWQGSQRWTIGKNSTAESGSNAGSDFVINRYADAGGFLGAALTITRSTGTVTMSGALTIAGDLNGVAVLRATNNVQVTIAPNTTSLDSSSLSWFTSFQLRWAFQKAGTESGSNSGSDLYVQRYSDAGALLGSAMVINRATGNVTIAGGLDLTNHTLNNVQFLNMTGVAATPPAFSFYVNSAIRWAVSTTNAESGGNSGSDLVVFRYSDAQASLGIAFQIVRSTGLIYMGGDLVAPNGSVGIGINPPSSTLHMRAGGANGVVLIDRAFTAPSHLILRGAAGTVASPTPTGNGLGIGRLSFVSYDGAWVTTALVGIESVATENQGPANHGAALLFFTVPNGSTTEVSRMKLDQDGTVFLEGKTSIVAPSTAGLDLTYLANGHYSVAVNEASSLLVFNYRTTGGVLKSATVTLT